tara:strand:+ start:94 stop:591 length:498 start_codon:yes stop_codon:yes gene_type:complete
MQCVWCGQRNDPETLELTGECQVCGELQIGNTGPDGPIDKDELKALNSERIDATEKRMMGNDSEKSLGLSIAVLLALKPNSSNKRNPIYLGTILLCVSLFLFGITYQSGTVEEPVYKILNIVIGNEYEPSSAVLESHRILNSLSLSGIALGSVMIAYSLISSIRR